MDSLSFRLRHMLLKSSLLAVCNRFWNIDGYLFYSTLHMLRKVTVILLFVCWKESFYLQQDKNEKMFE